MISTENLNVRNEEYPAGVKNNEKILESSAYLDILETFKGLEDYRKTKIKSINSHEYEKAKRSLGDDFESDQLSLSLKYKEVMNKRAYGDEWKFCKYF